MQEKFNNMSLKPPADDRIMDTTPASIDLTLLMEQIKETSSWKDGKQNALVIFKTDGLKIVLIALHKGAEMARHTADGIISVQVLEGRMQFNTDQQSVELNKGQMQVLHERIPHSVLAIDETIFMLTLIATASANRSRL